MLDQTRPVALLLARVAIGVIFFVHGYQKFVTMGLAGTVEFFESAGIPLAGVAAPAVAVLEVAGGLALVLGAALPVVSTLLAIDMIGAIVFVHGASGFSAGEGGYEFVLALAAGSLAVGFSGGGALALDGLLARRRAAAVVSA
ncbi:DoxX family protein [Nonomuraea sp. K274]|uniref:DoxX family protein n=1 Tax=Nonomuraea cypriaca TaxID=1187855 RepID=A0A931APU6_9ACTN|nr:DoxX family protein [Nonomuraea cypriaca]MBF8192782.1 DoxX family protein [Nonomuraea cypriaca]